MEVILHKLVIATKRAGSRVEHDDTGGKEIVARTVRPRRNLVLDCRLVSRGLRSPYPARKDEYTPPPTFGLSVGHVSEPGPVEGTLSKFQSCFPVCASNARMWPIAPTSLPELAI